MQRTEWPSSASSHCGGGGDPPNNNKRPPAALTIGLNVVRTNNLEIICGPVLLNNPEMQTVGGNAAAVPAMTAIPSGLSSDFPGKNCVLDGGSTVGILNMVSRAASDPNAFPDPPTTLSNRDVVLKLTGAPRKERWRRAVRNSNGWPSRR